MIQLTSSLVSLKVLQKPIPAYTEILTTLAAFTVVRNIFKYVFLCVPFGYIYVTVEIGDPASRGTVGYSFPRRSG